MSLNQPPNLAPLRTAALIAVACAAAGSVGLVIRAGRNGAGPLLLVIMSTWVLSPFVALVVANAVSTRWSAFTRTALYSVMLVIALGSLAVYIADALMPPKPQAAFVFVIVPPVSWLLMAAVAATAAWMSGRRAH